MIPKRVKLGGFLCYKDEQEIRFDGSSLWMLAGLNGSGKSSIFDAVTYALFNSHRGGSSNAVDLINKDCKSLNVEFDFELQHTLYQIRRTYRRDNKGGGKGTQQINRFIPETGSWEAVPDTNLAVGFKKWVDDHIGLNYEIFTSSVLLRQGHAEKLLEATPSDRGKVLSGIVDMDRFVSLHTKADEKRKKAKAEQEATSSQLESIPEVTDIEWAGAENCIAEAEEIVRQAEASIEALKDLEFRAKQWTELGQKKLELDARWAKFQATLGEAEKIEKAYHRYRELKEVIPPVLTIQAKQRANEESLARTKTLLGEQTKLDERHQQLQQETNVLRKKRETLQATLTMRETQLATLATELRQLSADLVQVRNFEQLSARCEQLQKEITQLPSVTREETEQLENQAEQLQRLALSIPLAEQWARQRTQLNEAQSRRKELDDALKSITQKGLETRKQYDAVKTTLEELTEARRKADERSTEARTRQQLAKDATEEFTKLDGAKICRACGQPLTASHFEEEKQRRALALKDAVQVFKAASHFQQQALVQEQECQRQFTTLQEELTKRRENLGAVNTEIKSLDQSLQHLGDACRAAFAVLSSDHQKLIFPNGPSDEWAATVWPTTDDLKKLKREAATVDSVKSQLTQARQTLSRLDKLRTERDSTLQQIEQVKRTLPPGEPASLRQRETTLKADEQGAQSIIQGAKTELKNGEKDLERLAKEITVNQNKLGEIKSNLASEESARVGYQDAIDRALQQIPETWRGAAKQAGFAEQSRWKSELDQLTTERIEAKYDELARVRADRDHLKREIDQVIAQREATPEAARQSPEAVRVQLATAREQAKTKSADLQEAQKHRAILERQRDLRQQLLGTLKSKDHELKINKLLAELLGKDRLQLHLLRTAESQIVEHANHILDRLSGGQLFLKLSRGKDGSGADSALDLEAVNRQTGGAPINVTFLSGSQRFRIAVSLALAIGRYASKQHRPIESVIIDEGFGCLDRNGRQVMIQELQNLRGHLECILLVSHQEEFAEAFPDGYKFEMADGTTKVTRFQS